MSTLTIRRLSPEERARLKARALRHGHSMEEEARRILRGALKGEDAAAESRPVSKIVYELFGPEHGVELSRPEVRARPDLPAFGD